MEDNNDNLLIGQSKLSYELTFWFISTEKLLFPCADPEMFVRRGPTLKLYQRFIFF